MFPPCLGDRAEPDRARRGQVSLIYAGELRWHLWLSIRIMKNILITRRECNLAGVISDITTQDDTIYIEKAGQASSHLLGEPEKMEILIIYCEIQNL